MTTTETHEPWRIVLGELDDLVPLAQQRERRRVGLGERAAGGELGAG